MNRMCVALIVVGGAPDHGLIEGIESQLHVHRWDEACDRLPETPQVRTRTPCIDLKKCPTLDHLLPGSSCSTRPSDPIDDDRTTCLRTLISVLASIVKLCEFGRPETSTAGDILDAAGRLR
ncbi:MAG: hypothetical protein AAF802_24120 [Planctomycetota bacterium]